MTTSRIYLKKGATGTMVPAEFHDEVDDTHLAMWEATWKPAMKTHSSGRTLGTSPRDRHWDWRHKVDMLRPYLGYHTFAIVCGGELQGLMLASDVQSARLESQFGKPLVYVEYVATAPWNRVELQKIPRFIGVGSVFIDAAIQLSLECSFRGRIGLHALPQSEDFYRKCGMSELGPDSAHEGLVYFEMTVVQAKAFRRERSRK